jgi:hypothetical protein
MAYHHGKYSVMLTATAIAATSSGTDGDVGARKWVPGYMPHILRAFSMTNTGSGADMSALVVALQRRGQGATTVTGLATLYGTATTGQGVVIYKDGLNATIGPGDEIRVNVSTKSAVSGGLMHYTMWVEPRWETPTNITNMKVTT